MKRKTSITLSDDLFEELDRVATSGDSRSAYIERVLRSHFRRRAKLAQEARDVELINAAADQLNLEMAEVLELQASWADDE
jgi:metal-responsive CopG/Arc/MetJ family transcriptional regulator